MKEILQQSFLLEGVILMQQMYRQNISSNNSSGNSNYGTYAPTSFVGDVCHRLSSSSMTLANRLKYNPSQENIYLQLSYCVESLKVDPEDPRIQHSLLYHNRPDLWKKILEEYVGIGRQLDSLVSIQRPESYENSLLSPQSNSPRTSSIVLDNIPLYLSIMLPPDCHDKILLHERNQIDSHSDATNNNNSSNNNSNNNVNSFESQRLVDVQSHNAGIDSVLRDFQSSFATQNSSVNDQKRRRMRK